MCKRKRILEEIEDHVLTLYTHGMSTRDIESTIKEIYGVDMSEAHISHVTDRIIEHIEQWKTRRPPTASISKTIHFCLVIIE